MSRSQILVVTKLHADAEKQEKVFVMPQNQVITIDNNTVLSKHSSRFNSILIKVYYSSLYLCTLLLSFISLCYAQPSNLNNVRSKPKVAKNATKQSPKKGKTKRELVESKILELKLALESTPNDLKALLSLSKLYIKLADYTSALTHLKLSIDLDPKNEDIHYLAAFTLRKLKRYQDAVMSYQSFLDLAKGSKRLSGLFGLAKTLDLMGDPKGAYELYKDFAEQETRLSQNRWVEEAKTSMRRIKASEVVLVDTDTNEDTPIVKEQEIETKINIKESLSLVLARADDLFVKQDYQAAGRLYEDLSRRELPKNNRVKVIYSAAVCKYLQAQFQESKALAEQALTIDSQSPALKGLAVLSHIQNREKQSKGPDQAQTLAQVRLAMKEGRLRNALAQINAFLDQAKGSIPAILLHAKGQVLFRLGEYSSAYQTLRQAGQGLNYPHLHLDLARTATALNQRKRAKKHYNDLIALLKRSDLSAHSQLAQKASKELEALNN